MGDTSNFLLLAKEVVKEMYLQKRSVKNLPRPCASSVYKTYKSSNQTNTCAEMASRFYYNKLHPGQFLNDMEALDSHTFDCQLYDKEDNKAYYHVNFIAKKGTGDSPPSLFFAELIGDNGPEKITICVELDEPGELENCAFCTGIWHPRNNFVGCMGPATKKNMT